MKIDQILTGGRRRLRTRPEKILMDADGTRLWADYMDVAPGFCGRFDFIHKINIPCLFYVECSVIDYYEPSSVIWKPSHIELNFERNGVCLHEKKFITWDNAAISCMVWENKGDVPFGLKLISGTKDGSFETTYGRRIVTSLFCNGERRDFGKWEVAPGEKVELCVAMQLCLDGEMEKMEQACRKLRECFCNIETAVQTQKQEYQEWFDKAPCFESDQPLIDKTWAYRWYILRHNLMNPEIGRLKETFFCEGRSHKMGKEPWHPEGWEFSKLIPLSVPMHLLDLRWYRDKGYGISELHVMRDNQDENGEFRCAKVDWQGNPYANFFGWSVWQYYLSSGDMKFVGEALPVVKKQIEAWKKKYGNQEDSLLIQYVHQLTGMEYQPSYWYFHGYPKECQDPNLYTPVKRVDRNVYHYLNMLGTSFLCEIYDDPDGKKYRREAERVRKDILQLMWDEKTQFFYDLHYQTNEKALVKNIVGFLPFFAGITEEKHENGLKWLFTEEFNTPCPFPSVSTQCPVYSAEGGWQGWFFKGRNGCIWNGPAWPFANSMILDGLAKESRKRNHKWDEKFAAYFMKFTEMHYNGGDGMVPYLVEHYNSMTGECISDDVDYSHSYYIDLIVSYVAGLIIKPGKIEVDPLELGLKRFRLSNIYVQGHVVEICLEENGKFSLSVDGEERMARKGIGKLEAVL